MFGSVLPVKCEMKVRDFEVYRAVYCGLCKQLGQTHGQASRFLLNYDLVFLALLADALSGEGGRMALEGCFANPVSRRHMLHETAGLRLAADVLVLLSYHKLHDDTVDEGAAKRLAARGALLFAEPMRRDAAVRFGQLDATLQTQMHRQQQLEERHCPLVDEACEPTARMCEAIFALAAPEGRHSATLARLGLFMGQIIYLLDAANDYEDDRRHGRYNVFCEAGLSHGEAVEAARRRCRMAAGEVALCYNLLPLCQYKDILENIVFLGLPAAIATAGEEQPQRRPRHGQIESV